MWNFNSLKVVLYMYVVLFRASLSLFNYLIINMCVCTCIYTLYMHSHLFKGWRVHVKLVNCRDLPTERPPA